MFAHRGFYQPPHFSIIEMGRGGWSRCSIYFVQDCSFGLPDFCFLLVEKKNNIKSASVFLAMHFALLYRLPRLPCDVKKCRCINLFTHGAPRSSQELFQKCPCIPGSNWRSSLCENPYLQLFKKEFQNRKALNY